MRAVVGSRFRTGNRSSVVGVAVVAVVFLAAGLVGSGCSSEEQTIETAAGEKTPEELAEALAESLRQKRESGPKEAELVAKYEPQHPPEIEARLVEIRFLENEDPQTLPRLEAELRDDHEAIRVEAIEKLEDIGGDSVLPLLGDRLASDPSVAVRLRVVEALDYVGGKVAADQLVRGLGDADAGVREAVAESLAFLATPEHRKALETARAKEGDREIQADLDDALENLSLPEAPPAAAEQPDSPARVSPATSAATTGAGDAEQLAVQ